MVNAISFDCLMNLVDFIFPKGESICPTVSLDREIGSFFIDQCEIKKGSFLKENQFQLKTNQDAWQSPG